MRDVELIDDTDVAYTEPGPGQFPVDTAVVDKGYNAADKANTMPGIGGELGACHRPMLSGPADGGLEKLEDGPTLVPAAPLVIPKVAYAVTGRSANPTTKARLYPWLEEPGTGLTWSYASQTAPALMMSAGESVRMAEKPQPDDDEGEEEEEEVEEPQEEGKPEAPKRRRIFKRGK